MTARLLRVGTSGFSYDYWRGGFYPEKLPASRMLAEYALRLGAVELNGTFYRTPPEATLRKWASETPAGFRFCVKAQRALTYSAAGFDKVGMAGRLGAHLGALGDRLGPVLVQWPPARKLDPGLLDAVLEALGRPAAVEFRDPSWFVEEVYRTLQRCGSALVVTDEDKWPLAPRVETAAFAYFRLRRGGDSALGWTEEVAAAAGRGEVYAFLKHEPDAPEVARALAAAAG